MARPSMRALGLEGERSPYGTHGQTGPYNQKNDPWNTRRPMNWNPGLDPGSSAGRSQMSRFTSGLRGPDVAPLVDPGTSRAQTAAYKASNSYGANRAAGQKVINARRAAMRDEAVRGDRTDLGFSVNPGGYDDTMRQVGRSEAADATPWGDFFAALIGKESNTRAAGANFRADIGQIGTTKQYDPVLAQTMDPSLGEGRARNANYSPQEQDYILSSRPAMAALRRYRGM